MVHSQNTGDNPFPHGNYKITTTQDAHYPGGAEALSAWIYDHMVYPPAAMKNKLSGKVTLSFDVLPDSSTTNIVAMDDPGNGFKDEAIRLMSITRFAPAILKGRAIRQQMILTIPFQVKGE